MNRVDFTTEQADPSGWRGVVGVGLVQAAAVLAWLWPIGLGGRMPVGGDVTQFSIGLMAVFRRALRAGKLPLWNDLWGYGFPGVGESQMGVYYPPHWLLYGLLPLEAGYVASLVLHTLWGSFGASWAARRFGVSAVGAGLAGFAWAGCGFFFIHLSHQWGATTGAWLPWAWGLAWQALRGPRPGRPWLLLATVLTLQLLPGHYQLAFVTQAGVLALAAAGSWPSRWSSGAGRGVAVASAILAAFCLAAAQLWPTLRLARLAESRRDFEYLSGFAASPLHLITFVAPGLFERSPLWRPIVWDPFHTSPEEYLGYVGLVPLFLAVVAIRGRWREAPAVPVLVAVGLTCLVFALGPYAPGFRWLCTLPGFSFFRAPARWMIGLSFVLCVLAGLGFDGLRDAAAPGRALRRFVAGSLIALASVVGLVELGLWAGRDRAGDGIASAYRLAFDRLPWGEPGVFAKIVADARRPFLDHRVYEAWARQGVVLKDAPAPVFAEQRGRIYVEELGPTFLLLAALLLASALSGRRDRLRAALVALAVADLLAFGRGRRVDLGPIAPLSSQSTVLEALAAEPRGTRTLDPLRNLPMVAGAAPASAYRTLDLPALEGLNALALRLPATPEERPIVAGAQRLTGASLRIYDPSELVERDRDGSGPPPRRVDDPALAGWRLGEDWSRQMGPRANRFGIEAIQGGGVRAWLVPLTAGRPAAILDDAAWPPSDVLRAMEDARPIPFEATAPERATLAVAAEAPSLLVVSILADPQWRGEWSGPSGARPATLRRAFGRPGEGAWLAVEVPGPGDWTLRLHYDAADVRQGLAASAAAAAAALILATWGARRWSRRPEGGSR